ncbi:MAG: hypothetical protein AAF202_02110 [Pseudomonadota bacterium]
MKIFAVMISASLSFLASTAIAIDSEKDVYQGISTRLVCHLDQERPVARIELSDYLDYESRTIVFYNDRGLPLKSERALCEYEEADYICRWGKTHILRIRMARLDASVANRLVPGKVLRGWVDNDVFRPGTGISCPLMKSPSI